MDNFFRALKLYVKAAANPFTVTFGVLWMVGLTILFAFGYHPVGDDDYASMIGVLGFANIGLFFIMFFGGKKTAQNKFYLSSSCAKHLFTTVPVFVTFVICLLYDTVHAVLAWVHLGSAGFSDVLLYESFCGAVMILGVNVMDKKKLEWLFVVPYVSIILLSIAVSRNDNLNHGFGVSVQMAVVIAVCVYAIGIAGSLVIANIWWKKGQRHSAPNQFIAGEP